ncbi:MAG TPA: tRNA (adenosine(37)-N6)-threonylcarbamoyltransferase complex transferase subunit TsaD [bacterium]|nr:tRNA (adenosine(37)-N6)-threonylcarbamoyltransferase complex transferase subunit TsaD [bacterium]HNS48563.1 tRNA (adenosine(37)-N6)-threonylcarbamoyltransferase complex transferase subunit TsaD [bacterium]
MLVLGIESSCDETAVALVADGRRILASEVASQAELHLPYGGVVPELASRRHLESLLPLYRLCLEKSGQPAAAIDLVAATVRPGLSGSLLVGESFGRALAAGLERPFLGIDHLEAHLSAGFPDGLPEFPALGLVVSGGHSSIFLVEDPDTFRLLGQTRDDAAGEVFDKVARVMDLPYPGGPPIERLALQARHPVRFPKPGVRNSLDFSFSGLKTAVIYYRQGHPEAAAADVAAGFQAAVAEGIAGKLDYALSRFPVKSVLTGGGVLANRFLRSRLETWAQGRGVRLYVPPIERSLDNAVMVAVRAFYRRSAPPGSGARPPGNP